MKRILLGLALALGAVSGTATAGCWSAGDKADMAFAELGGDNMVSFRDAVTCAPLSGATVIIDGQEFVTDPRGEVRVETLGMDDRRLLLQFRKSGYIDFQTDLKVAFGSLIKSRFAISPQLELGNLRFVLTWGAKPWDLDLHLEGPGFHISYQDMRSHANQARLDRDAREGYGPETITLARALDGASYELYVINYSDDAPTNAQATVSIYAEGRLFRQVSLPESRSRKLPIARIGNGRIEVLQ